MASKTSKKLHTLKKVLRFILIPVVVLLLLVGIAAGILYSQQQRLVELAVEKLNKQIPGQLAIGSSEFSLFQNYPYISIALNKVQFYPNKQPGVRPIYEAERLFVGFSLPDVLRQKYRVKALALKNGHLDLVEEADGQLNIIKASQMTGDTTAATSKTSTDLDLDIKKLVLKNMTISYQDSSKKQHLVTHIDRIQSSFRDNDQKVDADLDGTLLVDYTGPGDSTLFRRKHVETDIRLSYEKATKMLRLTEGRLKLEEAVFNIAGTADLLHDNLLDFTFSGDKPDFGQLFAFAPENLARELRHFRYDGHLSFDGKIKGNVGKGRQPLIELFFNCSNAWLRNTEANKKLDSLAFRGYYTNGPGHSLQTSELRLLDMHALPGKGLFRGNFVIRDFTDPKVMMQVNSDLELEFIGAFLGIRDLERVTGHINLKMNFKELVDLSAPQKEISELTEGIESELKVTDLTFRIPHYPYMVEHLNLHANMKSGFVNLDTLSFTIGHSDFHLDGSLSDLPALFHHQEKPVVLSLHAKSSKMILKELLASDTVLNGEMKSAYKEEIHDFDIALSLETSVAELQHPHPLPKGNFKIQNFDAAFKNYPHSLHDFAGQLIIDDTSLRLKGLTGQIDSSDIRFGGRVTDYALWFEKVKRGRTQIAFDLKSQRLAVRDLLGSIGQNYVPKDYLQEVATGVWLRSKIDLRYDSCFQFANIKIGNISATLQQHPIRLDSISGNIKFGIDDFVKIDTLKGRIGNSDFNCSMRLYAGKDTVRRKKENFLQFTSNLLDVDELSNYAATAEAAEQEEMAVLQQTPSGTSDSATAASSGVALVASNSSLQPATTVHADAFNIFKIPFIDFNASVSIGKMRYHHLGIKNLSTTIRMQSNQQLYLDTLSMDIAGGTIGARAHFNGADPKKIYLKSRMRIQDVNIEKLMLKADYLGQDYVINKNIKGTMSGQVTSYVQVHPDLTPLIDQSEAQIDVEICNGALLNFAPMQAMSSYFSDKNLNMVRFDTLRDVLTFKNGALTIPGMNINSSLGFMEISGTQSLDMHMEYFLRIPLKLVTQAGFHKLFGKKQEEVDPNQVDAIEYRDKDKKIHFINLEIRGLPDDYKVSLGKAKKA
jgi:AsmA-like C-terminal region